MFRRMKKMFKDEEGAGIIGALTGLAPSAVCGLTCGGVWTTFITAMCVMFSGACDIWTLGTSICCLGCGSGIPTGIYGLLVGAASACSIGIIDTISCFGIPAFAATLFGAIGTLMDFCSAAWIPIVVPICTTVLPGVAICAALPALPVLGLAATGFLGCLAPCLTPFACALFPLIMTIATPALLTVCMLASASVLAPMLSGFANLGLSSMFGGWLQFPAGVQNAVVTMWNGPMATAMANATASATHLMGK